MQRLIPVVLITFLILGTMGLAYELATPSSAPIGPTELAPEGTSCQAELDDLHAFAAEGMGFIPSPITKVIQVYGIAPNMELVPSGVILNFEESTVWYGKQQPFSEQLKWGFGGFRLEGDGSTKLTGVLIPVGGTIVDFVVAEGKMTPKLVPWEGAEETGSLVFKAADPNNTQTWTYVYSTYLPENWDCNAGSVFP